MTRRFVLLLAATAFSITLAAQESPLAVVAKVLSLSDEQTQALGHIVQSRAAAIQPAIEQIQARQQLLAQQLGSPDPDPQTVGQLFIEINRIQAQIHQAIDETNHQFEGILTPDQSARLGQIRSVAPVCDVIPAFKAVGLM